ncbi:MAG: hypothetical protein A2X56_01835 [Nitrospirae bacterium GWC2_57_13]|jgi:hypothetical protein|nr:MAG: hypothetical protein A2X56_01835 [Nitrospirae bacterium GWC2_57_13]HAS54105.1 hypothetical protein [Nitrospiraceae bacterium]
MTRKLTIGVLVLAFALGACAGRIARPIQAVWPTDETLSCEDMLEERRMNGGEIARLRAEKGRRTRHNTEALCLGFCIVPLFTMDLTDAQDIEIDAYKERIRRLEDLSRQKNCPPPPQR